MLVNYKLQMLIEKRDPLFKLVSAAISQVTTCIITENGPFDTNYGFKQCGWGLPLSRQELVETEAFQIRNVL